MNDITIEFNGPIHYCLGDGYCGAKVTINGMPIAGVAAVSMHVSHSSNPSVILTLDAAKVEMKANTSGDGLTLVATDPTGKTMSVTGGRVSWWEGEP